MFDIKFEINGRSVRPERIKDELERAFMVEVKDNIEKAIRGVRCTEHHQGPTVTVRGKKLDQLRIEVSGCCDDLIDRVSRRLS